MTAFAFLWAASEAWVRSDLIALWALIAGVIGICVASFTLHRGNLNSSVASMIPLNAEIREMYEQYIQSFASVKFETQLELESLEQKIATNLERLMNVLELAAAIEVEGTLSGVSRILMRDYLRRTLDSLIADDYTSTRISDLLQDKTTFIFIRRFLNRSYKVNAALPANWYADPDVSWIDRARSFFRY